MDIISPKWFQLKDVKLEISFNMLDVRSCQSEQGGPKSHNTPYRFSLPVSTPQLLAWTRLQVVPSIWSRVDNEPTVEQADVWGSILHFEHICVYCCRGCDNL